MDPFTSSIITVCKLIDFSLTLKDVPAKSRLFITQLDRVRADVDEALRERNEKISILELCPTKKAWIDGTIHDTRRALSEIGVHVEGPRVDLEIGRRVTLKHRFEWVLWHHQNFLMMESTLSTCHASLLTAITALQNLRTTESEPNREAVTLQSMPALRSPSARRPRRTKTSNSVDSVVPVEIGCTSPTEKSLSSPGLLEPFQWEVVSETSSARHSVSFWSMTTSSSVDPLPQLLTPASQSSISDAPQLSLVLPSDQEPSSLEHDTTSSSPDALDVENGKFNGAVKEDLLRRSAVQERRRWARARFGY